MIHIFISIPLKILPGSEPWGSVSTEKKAMLEDVKRIDLVEDCLQHRTICNHLHAFKKFSIFCLAKGKKKRRD